MFSLINCPLTPRVTDGCTDGGMGELNVRTTGSACLADGEMVAFNQTTHCCMTVIVFASPPVCDTDPCRFRFGDHIRGPHPNCASRIAPIPTQANCPVLRTSSQLNSVGSGVVEVLGELFALCRAVTGITGRTKNRPSLLPAGVVS